MTLLCSTASNDPTLQDELDTNKRRIGHVVAIEPGVAGGIMSRVTLFNGIAYSALLSRTQPKGSILKEALFFNLATHQVVELLTRPG